MGLLGVLLALLANLFLRNSLLDFVPSIDGLLVFVGLTTYDTQKLKKRCVNLVPNPTAQRAGFGV